MKGLEIPFCECYKSSKLRTLFISPCIHVFKCRGIGHRISIPGNWINAPRNWFLETDSWKIFPRNEISTLQKFSAANVDLLNRFPEISDLAAHWQSTSTQASVNPLLLSTGQCNCVRAHERITHIDPCGTLRRRELSAHYKSAGYRRGVASSLRSELFQADFAFEQLRISNEKHATTIAICLLAFPCDVSIGLCVYGETNAVSAERGVFQCTCYHLLLRW